MRFQRRRQDYSDTLKRDALALLVPIAATFAMILLWFFGGSAVIFNLRISLSKCGYGGVTTPVATLVIVSRTEISQAVTYGSVTNLPRRAGAEGPPTEGEITYVRTSELRAGTGRVSERSRAVVTSLISYGLLLAVLLTSLYFSWRHGARHERASSVILRGRGFNDLIEEALRGLLKKYREKSKGKGDMEKKDLLPKSK